MKKCNNCLNLAAAASFLIKATCDVLCATPGTNTITGALLLDAHSLLSVCYMKRRRDLIKLTFFSNIMWPLPSLINHQLARVLWSNNNKKNSFALSFSLHWISAAANDGFSAAEHDCCDFTACKFAINEKEIWHFSHKRRRLSEDVK